VLVLLLGKLLREHVGIVEKWEEALTTVMG
jgi:hypothetical protein